jgi:class 3 adenylate cyclase/CheY-like chemotaxis protein
VTEQASILVAEDDAVARATLAKSLERAGHQVTTAVDGREALELLGSELFDAVLLDILMPEVDGFAVLANMKADPRLRHLPVIMVTSIDDVASAVQSIELGADDYLTKPFDPVLLRARLNAGLTKKRLHDLEGRHLEEVTRLNHRLEARIEEQMAELVRTGELRRFLPHQVAEGLLSGRLGRDGLERRKVTILFADMVGFTDLSDSLDPEELADVLDEYLREMTAVLFAHGGTLDNYIGDGIMAVFGAPKQMNEVEQAWAAVESALAMRDRAVELAARIRGRGIPADLQIRVGVNAGHCMVGVFGSDVLRAYKTVGFAVNIAARLQTEAAPGTILSGYRTYALVRERVRAVRREPLTVKGAARPVEAWEILDLANAGAGPNEVPEP